MCGSGGPALRSAHLEYLGALRTICRLEKERAVGKRVRRFIHYLAKFDMRKDESRLVHPMMDN